QNTSRPSLTQKRRKAPQLFSLLRAGRIGEEYLSPATVVQQGDEISEWRGRRTCRATRLEPTGSYAASRWHPGMLEAFLARRFRSANFRSSPAGFARFASS